MSWRVIVGDCVDAMRAEPADSVDAIVTDPPYGLEFMGKEWDKLWDKRGGDPANSPTLAAWAKSHGAPGGNKGYAGLTGVPSSYVGGVTAQVWHQTWATEALRVLKPGAHLLAFGGTRTYHRLVCALEDAGFEIRDTLAWMYGSGFPKSLDVSKAIDKAAGAERELIEVRTGPRPGNHGGGGHYGHGDDRSVTAPATPAAQQWQGWGTALKPSWESIVLARKPLSEKTVAANVQRWGTGALNIDGTRIGTEGGGNVCPGGDLCRCNTDGRAYSPTKHPVRREGNFGRWPANLILDETAAALLDEQSGERPSTGSPGREATPAANDWVGTGMFGDHRQGPLYSDQGGASRFFYTAKASRRERTGYSGPNDHPTVKPVALMRWLVKLITPPERPCGGCCDGGTENQEQCCRRGRHHEDCAGGCNGTGNIGGIVLDPFMGTGTTGIAAVSEGFGFVGIDQDASYVSLAERRIHNEGGLFSVQEEVTTQEPTR